MPQEQAKGRDKGLGHPAVRRGWPISACIALVIESMDNPIVKVAIRTRVCHSPFAE